MKADLARERSVWLEFGGAGAGSRVHLVEAVPGEADPVRAVAAVEITVDRAKDKLTAPLGVEGDVGGLERVGWTFTFTAAAYNLIRIPKLLGA